MVAEDPSPRFAKMAEKNGVFSPHPPKQSTE